MPDQFGHGILRPFHYLVTDQNPYGPVLDEDKYAVEKRGRSSDLKRMQNCGVPHNL